MTLAYFGSLLLVGLFFLFGAIAIVFLAALSVAGLLRFTFECMRAFHAWLLSTARKERLR